MSNTVPNRDFRLEDFEYDLPEDLIAQQPPPVRHGSRLMWLDRAEQRFEDRQFAEISQLLLPGDLLIVNDTKVIPARLAARRQTGGQVEILLIRAEPSQPWVWQAMAAPMRKLKVGEKLVLEQSGDEVTVRGFATIEEGQRRVMLDFGTQQNLYRILSEVGFAPLPPYIRRQLETTGGERRGSDLERYQTIFAKAPGAVAAPTAGLHFSQEIFAELERRGVEVRHITLHVGPGTFKPITSSLEEHSIEAETFSISQEVAEAINNALSSNRRVVAVGTTSCRALETAGRTGRVQAVENEATNLYIRPGFEFRVVKALVTNFHLSKSSLLVLVSAFAGHELTMRAYRHAVDERYRFYSYGDAMLIT
jgi:S-adenosylmethionine:tRNA ribosyltransferase-isomerase